MQFVLFDDESHLDLLPLTFTRPIAHLRLGALTILEKWAFHLKETPKIHAWGHLNTYFAQGIAPTDTLWINAKFLPNADYSRLLLEGCAPGKMLVSPKSEILAFRTDAATTPKIPTCISGPHLQESGLQEIHSADTLPDAIRFPWDLFLLNKNQIVADINILKETRSFAAVGDPHTAIYGRDNIFAEPGVKVRAAILNAEDGPIYLGANADIQEGAIIHGAHAICSNATVNMGAKMRGDSTVGPHSKVGGEVANSVIMGYSNKGHDGYLGNSVLGHWCNLGADTNTSNLKNNYAEVRVWNYRKRSFIRTGQLFCGLIMGDHSKCGINTMFNTGTVVGVSANIFGDGYPRNFVPSFSWGGAAGFTTFALNKSYEVAEAVMGRRGLKLSDDDREILKHTFETTSEFRTWERDANNETR